MVEENIFGDNVTSVIRETQTKTRFISGRNFARRRRVVLYVFPIMWIDPHANVWVGTYEKRRNELSPLGRHGSLWQRFGTKSPVFKISGKMNFENIIKRSLPYLRAIAPNIGGDGSAWYDPRVAKFIFEYLWQADVPMLMMCDLDMSIVVLDKMEWKQDANEQLAYHYTFELVEVRPIPLVVKGPSNFLLNVSMR